MRALIVYGTTEGHTATIARFAAERLIAAGIDADHVHVDGASAPPAPDAYSIVMIAASLHGGAYQKPVLDYVRKHRRCLNAMPSVFLSVSLSAASNDHDDLQGLYDCNADFLKATGWRPAESHLAAGAFRFSQYDFLKTWAMKYIAWRKGRPTDAGKDYVLTDWDELGRIVDRLPKLAMRTSAVA